MTGRRPLHVACINSESVPKCTVAVDLTIDVRSVFILIYVACLGSPGFVVKT